jgi:chromosomal replication initiation ATPase DnaA
LSLSKKLQVFLRKKTVMSYAAIGKFFNPIKDHTTVVSAEKKISDLMFSDESVLNDINAINDLLNK